MQIARIVGNIVSTFKVNDLKSAKLYIVQMLDIEFNPTNDYQVVIDTVGIGFGDNVLVCTGSAARMTERTKNMPTDMSIIARMDFLPK